MRMEKLSSLAVVTIVLFHSLDISKADPCSCRTSGNVRGKKPPLNKCNRQHDSDCCKQGENYPISRCSPPVSRRTKVNPTINGFDKGEDGGAPSACDGKFPSNNVPIVSLLTGWFNEDSRCMKNITIYGNRRKVDAMVVDECDSAQGCDAEHAFQPPCPNKIVDASDAVWKALGVPKHKWGQLDVIWSDTSPRVRKRD